MAFVASKTERLQVKPEPIGEGSKSFKGGVCSDSHSVRRYSPSCYTWANDEGIQLHSGVSAPAGGRL